MERVVGIGGFFFPARDPAGLAMWYRDRLGIDLPPSSYDQRSWWQSAGPTEFTPYTEGSPPRVGGRGWQMNFRVADLNRMAAQLRAAGEVVEVDPETYPNGRFAWLADPEGNPVQLWEPMGPDVLAPSDRQHTEPGAATG